MCIVNMNDGMHLKRMSIMLHGFLINVNYNSLNFILHINENGLGECIKRHIMRIPKDRARVN